MKIEPEESDGNAFDGMKVAFAVMAVAFLLVTIAYYLK